MSSKIMQPLSLFVNQNLGQYIEKYDPGSPNQCFDLVIAWCDALGIPRQPTGTVFPFVNAYQIYTDFGPLQARYFERIANSPTFIPREGDVGVWGAAYGPAGHTAVCTGQANLDWFSAFSQNDPIRSRAILRTYNYQHFLGVLRPKNYNPTNQPSLPMVNESERRAAVHFDILCRKLSELGKLKSPDREKNTSDSVLLALTDCSLSVQAEKQRIIRSITDFLSRV